MIIWIFFGILGFLIWLSITGAFFLEWLNWYEKLKEKKIYNKRKTIVGIFLTILFLAPVGWIIWIPIYWLTYGIHKWKAWFNEPEAFKKIKNKEKF
ncbi:hypothetical protein [Spiroplasma floricola]|uniref:Uncharacterized protein n=1 Tax=Spiroplasma floricola 23-6 TaxID=1336749 RepID=A0A2K8SGS7_9MOLU|nr:hypothetical protein [Spiroplasma floricola]AUB32030.1 hypothetical protein SFLOR_v1c09820 [Spiroplasma floricola 23-6]